MAETAAIAHLSGRTWSDRVVTFRQQRHPERGCLELLGADRYTLRDGKATERYAYFDRAHIPSPPR
jgi:hypothetical protein